MKKLILGLLLLTSLQTLACDVCNVYEYANRNNKSYIGAFYRYRLFNGYSQLGNDHNFSLQPQNNTARIMHDPESYGLYVDRTPKDYERYQTMEIRGNWAIREKWNLTVFIPFVSNEIYFAKVYKTPYPVSDSIMRMSGLSDIIVGGEYVHTIEKGDFKHFLKPGVMLKLPTGKSNGRSPNGEQYQYELQPGTSSWDFILRGAYTVTYKNKLGLENYLSYKLTTRGTNDHLLGNRFNWMGNVFGVIEAKEDVLRLIPKVGVYFEQARADYQGMTEVSGSGGYSWFYNLGLDVSIKAFTVQFMYQRIMNERLNGNVMGNAGRLQTGVIFNF